jgi:hypothetical protein
LPKPYNQEYGNAAIIGRFKAMIMNGDLDEKRTSKSIKRLKVATSSASSICLNTPAKNIKSAALSATDAKSKVSVKVLVMCF